MKSLKIYLLIFSVIIYSTNQLWAMDGDGEEDSESPRYQSIRYITSPSDEVGSKQQITLTPLTPQAPFLIGDAAKFNFGRHQFPVLDSDDHLYHYITGLVNQTVFRRTRACHINYLLLGLDAFYEVESPDGVPSLRRKMSPLLYDRQNRRLSVSPNGNTEYCVFLSFSENYSLDRQNVVNLSKDRGWNVTYKNQSYKVYFHPSNIATDNIGKNFISQHFQNQKTNFDSEINATYTLLQNPGLITQFLETLDSGSKVVSLGLRYYSFLDMCGRCQSFLEDVQAHLKPLFTEALKSVTHLLYETDKIPFVVVAHSNRIYTRNKYVGAQQIKETDYPYATSGSKSGTFLDYLEKNVGTLTPLTTGKNRLVAFIHEPDLGDGDEHGIVRQYFTNLKVVNFSNADFNDQHALTLAGKLKRASARHITSIDLSKNDFGIEEPEFADDPIPLTGGKDLIHILNFMSGCINLQKLNLGHNHFAQDEPFEVLIKVLPNLTQLKELDLRAIGAGETAGSLAIKRLLENFPSLTRLETLNLSRNSIYYEGVEALIDVLPRLINLKNLGLAYGALCHKDGREDYDDPYIGSLEYTPEILESLSEAIISHPQIQFIDMRRYKNEDQQEEMEEKKDMDEFVQVVTQGKPGITILKKSKLFVPPGSYYADGEIHQ